MIRLSKNRVLSAGSVAAIALFASTALADDAYTLAASKTHKLQILADGGATWCSPTLRLRMVLESDSPDVGNTAAQLDMMNRLKTPITTDCKTATSADLSVSDGSKTRAYRATAATGWAFAEVKTAAAEPAAPASLDALPSAQPVAAPVAPAPASPQAPASAGLTVPAAAPPAVAPAATPAVSTTPAVAVAAPVKANENLTILKDFPALVVQLIRRDPTLEQHPGTIKWWAGYRFNREYLQYQNQEFKLAPVLERAKADLDDTILHSDPDRVLITFGVSFQAYDFATERFPIVINGDQVRVQANFCCVDAKFTSGVAVKMAGLDAITGLPMDKGTAPGWIEKRTRWGSIDRNLVLVITVKLDPEHFKTPPFGDPIATGSVERVVFYGDQNAKEPLYTIGEEELTKLRTEKEAAKAAAAAAAKQRQEAAQEAERQRMAEFQRQQLVAQREQNIKTLASMPVPSRLANFISKDPINFYARLDNLRSARAASILNSKPVNVEMLVQSDSSGHDKVAAEWPGQLQVTVPESLPALKSSGWYLIRGQLTVPAGDDLPVAQLVAEDLYACTQPKCAEAADPTAIVDRKIGGASATNTGSL